MDIGTHMQRAPGRPGAEIRVHGVGDHDLLSALGAPKVLNPESKRSPSLVLPPRVPRHSLVLVNWSRMSRSAPAVLWYLAFPFTLVNLADAMRPTGSGRAAVHRCVVWSTGAALTGTATVWVLAITERVLFLVDLPDGWEARRDVLAAVLAGAVLILPMATRALVRSESWSHRPAALVHVGLVAATCSTAFGLRPAQQQVDPDGVWRLAASPAPDDAQFAALLAGGSPPDELTWPVWLDVLALAAGGSLAVAVGGAIVLWATALRAEDKAPLLGSALSLLLGTALLNLLTGGLLLGLGRLVARAQDSRWIPVLGAEDRYRPGEQLVLGRFATSYATALVTAVSLVLIAVVLLSLVVAARPGRVRSWRGRRRTEDVGRWAHDQVARLPALLQRGLAVGAVLGLVVLGLVLGLLVWRDGATMTDVAADGSRRLVWPRRFGLIASAGVLVSVGAFFLIRNVNRLAPVRNALAVVGDVAGFWPITVHPLGARTYRSEVTAGIRDALRCTAGRRTVLTGHSQGSVVCAWALAAPPDADPPGRGGSVDGRPFLVTCGSPLQSLYATFFPREFDRRFFTALAQRTRGWHNFWRATDPIAMPVDAGVTNEELPDPLPGGDRARGHSDYWSDPRQRRVVAALLADERAPVPAP